MFMWNEHVCELVHVDLTLNVFLHVWLQFNHKRCIFRWKGDKTRTLYEEQLSWNLGWDPPTQCQELMQMKRLPTVWHHVAYIGTKTVQPEHAGGCRWAPFCSLQKTIWRFTGSAGIDSVGLTSAGPGPPSAESAWCVPSRPRCLPSSVFLDSSTVEQWDEWLWLVVQLRTDTWQFSVWRRNVPTGTCNFEASVRYIICRERR